MSKTFIKVFKFNYNVSSMSDSYVSLEQITDEYMQEHKNLTIKQIEFMWGDSYGARVAVVFEDLGVKTDE